MGMSYQDAKRLGIERYWPSPARPLEEAYPAPRPRPPADGMNKLERDFWERLQDAVKADEFTSAWREPIVLRLAGRTTYKPDFMTLSLFNNQLAFWETKGWLREDAAVKLKVAAAQFPCFRWVLVQKDCRKWRCIEVTDRGFSRDKFCPSWLA